MTYGNIRKLIGPSEEDMEIANMIARQLSQQFGQDVEVMPTRTILHPDEMWKDDEHD